MSITVSTPAQICNSPLNTSPTKMQWSFPKSPKFKVDIKPACDQICYDLPPLKSDRTTTFGYGTKYDFTKMQVNTPAPNAYSTVDPADGKSKKKGISFGLSREAMAVTGGQFVGEKASPGPGAYDTRGLNKVAIAFTFKGRTQAPETLTTVRQVPGPGAYPVYSALNPKGQYFVSKYKDSGANTFAPPKSARFPENKESKLPGPGDYEVRVGISPSGSYCVSKFKSSQVRTFGHSPRNPQVPQLKLNAIPGPGQYRAPSDFGHYETKQIPKTDRDLPSIKSVQRRRQSNVDNSEKH